MLKIQSEIMRSASNRIIQQRHLGLKPCSSINHLLVGFDNSITLDKHSTARF